MRRKHWGKRRNCSLRAISPFPTVFSKGLFPRGVKRCHCVGLWEMEKMLLSSIFSLPRMFSVILDLFCHLQMLSIWLIDCMMFNPLPDDKILDWSKLKQIADGILKSI